MDYTLEVDHAINQARLSLHAGSHQSILSRWSVRKNDKTGLVELASLSENGAQPRRSVLHTGNNLTELANKLSSTLGKPVALRERSGIIGQRDIAGQRAGAKSSQKTAEFPLGEFKKFL
jgi:hypothetical protein